MRTLKSMKTSKNTDACLTEGREVKPDFCLGQGQGLSTPSAPPHPNMFGLPTFPQSQALSFSGSLSTVGRLEKTRGKSNKISFFFDRLFRVTT